METNLIMARAENGDRASVAALGYEPPVIARVPAADVPPRLRTQPGRSYAALCFSYTFGSLPTRWRYRELFIRIQFDPPSTHAVDVQACANPTLPVSIWTTEGNTVGCLFGPADFPGPVTCTVRTLLDIPAELAVLNGSARAEASIRGRPTTLGLTRSDHIHSELPPFFELDLPRTTSAGIPSPSPHRPPSAVRLCVAADIEAFSRFHSPQATRAQQRFVDALSDARHHAGIDETLVELQQAGDGQLAILPPAIDESVVIPRFIEGLALALAEINADLNAHARLRIRIGLHRGHVSWGINGWIGDSTIAVHRLLDCPAIRGALRTNPSADFALIVPDTLYQDVISHQPPGPNSRQFHPTVANLPDKNFTEQAWIHVP